MSSMFAFRAPYDGSVDRLTFVCSFLLAGVSFHLLSVCIKNRNGVQANRTFGKHDHALDAMHDLSSVIFCKIVISFKLRLFGVNIYLFR